MNTVPFSVSKKVDPKKLKLDVKQIARHQGTENFKRLIESVRQFGLLQSPGTIPDGTAVWGTGRVLAAIEVGLPEITVIELVKPMTETEYLLLRWEENESRQNYTPAQRSDSCAELLAINPTWTQKDAAMNMKISQKSVTQLMAVFKCIPEVSEAYRQGLLTPSDCSIFSMLPEQEQRDLFAIRKQGTIPNREELRRQAEKLRKLGQPEVRTTNAKMFLPNRVKVVVSGDSLSLEQLIEFLSQALDRAKRAYKEGLDIRTMQTVLQHKNAKEALNGKA